jgi:hypothetical protein
MIDPVQAALDAAANQATQAATTETVEVIQQEAVAQNQQVNQNTGLQTVNTSVATHQAPASPLTMDDSAVTAVSGVSNFVKLRDGGLELDGEKFGPTKFKLKMDGVDKGGAYQPCFACNYNSPAGQVYTRSYDGVKTVSLNPSHDGLDWNQNVALCQAKDPKAFTYTAFELTLELAEDTVSADGKTTIPAGTKMGYTTPYTAAKTLKALWDKALSEGKRGETFVVELSGEEVKNDKGSYKKLILKQVD